MKKLLFISSSVLAIALLVISISLFSTSDTQAYTSNEYEEVPYQCASGETIDRCTYGSAGCDIPGQELCDTEREEEN